MTRESPSGFSVRHFTARRYGCCGVLSRADRAQAARGIDLVVSGEIEKSSTVLYAHLGSQPALNAYSALLR